MTPQERRIKVRADFERAGVAQVRLQVAANTLAYPDYLSALEWLAEKDRETAERAAHSDARRERRENVRTAISVFAIVLSMASLAVSLAAFFRH